MENKMNEISQIQEVIEPYIQGFGIDTGCGNKKVCDAAIGLDKANHPCVTICHEFNDLSLFGDSQFDYAVASHFLEHIKEPLSMIKEMKRVVKDKGFLDFMMPDPKLYKEKNPVHISMIHRKSFKSKLKNLDLTILIDDTVGYSYYYICRVEK